MFSGGLCTSGLSCSRASVGVPLQQGLCFDRVSVGVSRRQCLRQSPCGSVSVAVSATGSLQHECSTDLLLRQIQPKPRAHRAGSLCCFPAQTLRPL